MTITDTQRRTRFVPDAVITHTAHEDDLEEWQAQINGIVTIALEDGSTTTPLGIRRRKVASVVECDIVIEVTDCDQLPRAVYGTKEWACGLDQGWCDWVAVRDLNKACVVTGALQREFVSYRVQSAM
jgi:hypothetical protein